MTGRLRFISHISLVCILLLSGCQSGGKSGRGGVKLGEIEKTAAEKRKEALLQELDNKFENPGTHFELGKVYQSDGLWTKAENEFSVALSFDPVHREAQAARIKVLAEGGDQPKAGTLADIYMDQAATSPTASLRLALAFQKEGLDEYALGCYQQALRMAPNSAKINRQIGYYYLSKNEREQAKGYLSRSFQLDPYQPEVAGELGRLGVVINVPRKTEKNTKQLDQMVEKASKRTGK